MNLLVTGGAGFIGSNLIRHVIDRPEVGRLVNLDALTYAGDPENVKTVSGWPNYHFEEVDLRELNEVRRIIWEHQITHVIHLAAESDVDRSIAEPVDFVQTNIVGTFNLLEACREAWERANPKALNAHRDDWVGGAFGGGSQSVDEGGPRLIHVSTDEVYGALGATGFFTEFSPYAPSSPYSASKASSDMLVKAYYRTYGLPVVITNCSNNYGPLQYPEKLIPVVIDRLLERKPVPVYGDGLHVRDWLYVEDHAEALWQVLRAGRIGETYNIGANNERSNLEVVRRLCDLVDELRPDLGGNSRELIGFVGDRPGHDRRYAMDAAKIRHELGWKPRHSFEEGIRKTVEWHVGGKPELRCSDR